MNHHDDYPYPPIAVTPMFRGVRVEEFFVLNLCCGHRRAGDIEDLSKEVAAFLPFKLWVISIDIVSGNDAHDLMNATSVRRIRENIKSGRIHFWVIGIPCKTWTAVRFRELLTLLGQKGPRPFRSAEEPRALRHLTKREYRQLYVGNTLLQTTGSLVADSLEAGAGGIVGHQDEPSQKAYPSIWRLPVFRRVAAHPQLKPVLSALSRALWASHRPSLRVSLQLDVDTSNNILTCSRLPRFVREGSPASSTPLEGFQHPNSRHIPRDSMVQLFLLSCTLPSLHVLMIARTNFLVSCFRLSMLCSHAATASQTPISCSQIINRR